MLPTGSWPLLLLSLLSYLFSFDPSLGFSLKNCVILYSEKASNLSVTCAKHSLTAIPDDIPKNAVSLNLTLNSISNITCTNLRGLSQLRVLHAKYNLISHIDGGAFADLAELKILALDYNKLTNLTDNMFEGLSKLKNLSLKLNNISFISPLAFQPLVSLQFVDLSSSPLQDIADLAPLLKLPHIQILNFGQSTFPSFQSTDLPLNTSNLRVLDLISCSLKNFSITEDMFPHLEFLDFRKCNNNIKWHVSNKTFLRSLTRLYLDGTRIRLEVYKAMLKSADSLQYLKLHFMREWIYKDIIDVACRIPSLRILELGNNKIPFLKNHTLRSCSHLTELRLPYNKLFGMSNDALQSITNLYYLDLKKNVLSKLPVAVRGLSKLEVLDLSFNVIGELDCNDLKDLTRLKKLYLTHNRISKLLKCVFQNLNYLKVLKIEKNEIFSFQSTFQVNLSKLQSLYLSDNDLSRFSKGDFQNLSSLYFLDLLSDNSYIDHSEVFQGLNNLHTLYLSVKGYVTNYFKGLSNLESLTLRLVSSQTKQIYKQPFLLLGALKKLVIIDQRGRHENIPPNVLNGLKSLENLTMEKFIMGSLHPDTFKYTPRLKVLKIANSELSDLTSEVFWPIPNLEMLDLSNNKLISLEFLAKANLLELRWLKLTDNAFSSINQTVLNSLPALTYLDLSANPLTCECFNAEFNKWIQSNNQTQVVNAHQYTCAFPASQQGNRFLDFNTDSCWVDTSFLCFLLSFCVIVLTLLTSFIYHFLRWHLTYAYHLFLAFLYDNQKRKKGTAYNYDAFVSYNVHDEAWVYGDLLPVLEGQQGWRLCLHHRDFEPGKPIVENITEAIYSSRKTICVISQNYLQSEWCSREIQMASFRLFDEHKDVLIMVFLEEIPAKQLSPYYRMRSLVKKRTYLSWPQAGQHTGVFWQKIRQALERAENPTEHADLLTGHPTVIQ